MDRPPPMMASLTPIEPEQNALLQELRKGYQVYCASQSVPILNIILNNLGDHVLKQEVKDIYNRLVQKGIPGLPHAAHAVLLFCIFECLCHASQINPQLIERFRMMLAGLEQRFDYLPLHCGSNNAIYNHLYGLFAACVIADEAISLSDLARIFRNSEGNDVVLQGFESWMSSSHTVSNYGTHPAFNNALRDAVRGFLDKAPNAQPHILISVIIAVEQWAVYVSVAGHMANFGVGIDLDPRKMQLGDQSLPVPVPANLANLQARAPTQRTVFTAPGSQHAIQVLPPVSAPMQSQGSLRPTDAPSPESTKRKQAQQGDQSRFSPASPRNFSPRRAVSVAQQGGRHQGLLGTHLAQYAQGQRRASAPQVNGFGIVDPQADADPAATFRSDPRSPTAPSPAPGGDSDTIKVSRRRPKPPRRSNFAEVIANDGDIDQPGSSVQRQPTIQSRSQQTKAPAAQMPLPPRPVANDSAASSRSSTRRRSAAAVSEQVKYDQDSDDDEDEEQDPKMAVPDDDPNDGDFVG